MSQSMKIAILGWGSLIWDTQDLPISGKWEKGGPVIPVEFSRISKDGRLTLVIDEKNGLEVFTRFALSSRTNLDFAREDLKKRERTSTNNIGFVNLQKSEEICKDNPKVCDCIQKWAKEYGFDAAIWTALPSNFLQKTGTPFDVKAAFSYLNCLTSEKKEKALEYIRKAPEEVITPLRQKVNESKLFH